MGNFLDNVYCDLHNMRVTSEELLHVYNVVLPTYLIAKNVSTETVALSIALNVHLFSSFGNIAAPLAEKNEKKNSSICSCMGCS